jgi:hypothetical protein
METTWKIVAALMAVCGFIWTGFSASNLYASLNGRIDSQAVRIEKLERQITLGVSGGGLITPDATPKRDSPVSNVGSGVVTACIDFAKRTATARESNNSVIAGNLEGLMRDTGCYDVLKAAGK